MCSCDDQQMTALDLRRATVFGQEAQEYHRWRPSYPPEAVDWVVPTGARDVLDLGAGTGKLTALLARPCLQVQAAEPDLRMLAVLRRHLPNVKAHHAPAERLPIADDSLDAVLVADAWHWFPHAQAIAEVRRVLRAGGRLALIWNTPQLATGWTSQVAQFDPDADTRRSAPTPTGLPADDVETAVFSWDWQVDAETVAGSLGTNSAYLRADPEHRRRHMQHAAEVVTAACQVAGTPTIPWPQRTTCIRWHPDRST